MLSIIITCMRDDKKWRDTWFKRYRDSEICRGTFFLAISYKHDGPYKSPTLPSASLTFYTTSIVNAHYSQIRMILFIFVSNLRYILWRYIILTGEKGKTTRSGMSIRYLHVDCGVVWIHLLCETHLFMSKLYFLFRFQLKQLYFYINIV